MPIKIICKLVPPDIIDGESSGDVMVTEGSNTTLRCIASGFPQPTITWRREDNLPIQNHGTNQLNIEFIKLLCKFSNFSLKIEFIQFFKIFSHFFFFS